MIEPEQIAHDLAIAYVNNRHGAEVTGTFDVSGSDGRTVTGYGRVSTQRFPDVGAVRTVKVGTGEKHLFGMVEKKERVPDGHKIDPLFAAMLSDYRAAYTKFLALLENP